ncbi:hypothetical protein D046_2956B, partial [Vibrio parahaemolyticus V-223/04]
KSSKAT